MRNVLFFVLVLSSIGGALTAAAEPIVTFEQSASDLKILVDGRCAAVYVWEDDAVPRPYFRGVKAPSGAQATRNYPTDPVADKNNDDHATYHPGVWLAFGDIKGADFWRNKARVRHLGFAAAPKGGAGTGSFAVLNAYENGRQEIPTRMVYKLCKALGIRASEFMRSFTTDFPDSFAVTNSNSFIALSQVSETLFILTIPFFLNRFGIKTVMIMSMIAWYLHIFSTQVFCCQN